MIHDHSCQPFLQKMPTAFKSNVKVRLSKQVTYFKRYLYNSTKRSLHFKLGPFLLLIFFFLQHFICFSRVAEIVKERFLLFSENAERANI